eukprot:542842_1
MRFTHCICFYTVASTITRSVYSQSNDIDSTDSSSKPSAQAWAAIVIGGLLGILVILIAADCLHKSFQREHANMMANVSRDKSTYSTKPAKSWAQQPHLKSRPKPKQSAPKTTDTKPKQVNGDTDALVITKQATDAVMAGQATDNNEQAIVAVDEASEANNNAFPDTPNEATDDVQIQMDDDIEIVTEDSVNIKQTPTPSDDAEIVVKLSEEKSQSSAATQEDKVDHVKVGTPIRVTLESAWNSGGSDDEDGSAEDRDMMGDLASVRVEIDRRVLNN